MNSRIKWNLKVGLIEKLIYGVWNSTSDSLFPGIITMNSI